MKKLISTLLLSACCCAFGFAQTGPALDKSPMDISMFPANYSGLRAQGKPVDPLVAKIVYSRPQKNNRVIFGDLLKYNEVWRLGANENTEIEFLRDVTINNTKIKKGRYSVFAIPMQDKWTIIFNSDLNEWGAYKYDQTKDVLRVDVPVQAASPIAEVFYIIFEKSATGFNMISSWDNVKVSLPITL